MSDVFILVQGVFTNIVNLVITPFLIHKLASYEGKKQGLIFSFIIIWISSAISSLIFSQITNYITFSAFPDYVDGWLSFKNIAIQWFFRILFNIADILIVTLLIIYIYELMIKKAIISAILIYAFRNLSWAFLTRILSMIFSMVTIGGMSYGPI